MARLAVERMQAFLRADELDQVIAHPLGFTCVRVRKGSHGVCVHVWAGEQQRSRLVHSHSWHLRSEVVLGAMVNEIAEVAPDQDGDRTAVVVRSELDLIDELIDTGQRMRMRSVDSSLVVAGQTYSMPAGTFHRSVPQDRTRTVTLLATRATPAGQDIVLDDLGVPRTRFVRRAPVPAVAARRLLGEIVPIMLDHLRRYGR